MHITKSTEKITPFDGFNFCLNSFYESGLADLIDRYLGLRVQTVGFSYSDIIANQMGIFLCGGDCAEDINKHLSGPLDQVKGLAVCSADTILRGIKELGCPSKQVINPDSGVAHQFNINGPLKELMLGDLRETGQLGTGTNYDLDYDNQVIATKKWDAARTYKSSYGYQPAIASIGNMPVYIEGRGGNSQAKYKQEETLMRAFRHQVTIGRFRADQQADLFSGQAYTWRAILSNDHLASPEQIVAFYNKRWDSERLFNVMNNDFGWSRLPCSFLSENIAFMILTAIIANFYRYIIGTYSKSIPWLTATFRVKKFIFRFFSVPAKWIRSGRRAILKLYTDKDYSPLLE